LDPEVDRPHRWRGAAVGCGRGRDARDRDAALVQDRVMARLGPEIGCLPAEYAAVEGCRGGDVPGGHVEPARRAGCDSRWHLDLLCVWPALPPAAVDTGVTTRPRRGIHRCAHPPRVRPEIARRALGRYGAPLTWTPPRAARGGRGRSAGQRSAT